MRFPELVKLFDTDEYIDLDLFIKLYKEHQKQLQQNWLSSAEFKSLVKDTFAPILRSYGFIGSGFHFRKITKEHYIYAVTIQANRYGGSCCVELGVQLDFLPNTIEKMIPSNKVTAYDCELRRRLSGDGETDHWWEYGNTKEEALKSINNMTETFINYGLPFFNMFTEFPNPLTLFTISDLENNTKKLDDLELALPTEVRLAMLLARVYLFLGDKEQARKFAEWGLANVERGILLIPIFEEIIARTLK